MRGRGALHAGLGAGLGVLTLAAVAVPAEAAPTSSVHARIASIQSLAADPVAVDAVRVTPAALGPTTALTVGATVRNTGASPLTVVSVRLRLSRVLATRSETARWAQGDETIAYRTVGDVVRLPRPLAPGAAAPVSLSVPAGGLGLDAGAERPEARGVEVHVDAQAQQAGSPALPTARARSFVVWQPRPVDRPVQLTLLAPVTGPVAVADAGSATAHPAEDWSPSGRLSRLLRATAGAGFSYVIDPALFTTPVLQATWKGAQSADVSSGFCCAS